MQALGIASRHGGISSHSGGHSRTAAAGAVSVVGAVARRAQEYRDESDTWAWWLADFDAERGFGTQRVLRCPRRATTQAGVSCSAVRFPAAGNGRRCWREGLGMVRSGVVLPPAWRQATSGAVRAVTSDQGRNSQGLHRRARPDGRSDGEKATRERGQDPLVRLPGQ